MNSELLEYYRRKKKLSTEEFCRLIGISRAAYYRKRCGRTEFTRQEIENIVRVLELDSPLDIFFADGVS